MYGSIGRNEGLVKVRFGKIKDFPEVAEQFKCILGLESEIGFLGPDPDSPGWKGGLHSFKFEAERRDFEFRFYCGNVTIEKQETTQQKDLDNK